MKDGEKVASHVQLHKSNSRLTKNFDEKNYVGDRFVLVNLALEMVLIGTKCLLQHTSPSWSGE